MKPTLFLIAALVAAPSIAGDTYTPAPLQLLTERVNEHDQQICDLGERIDEIEAQLAEKSTTANEAIVRVVVEREQAAAKVAARAPSVTATKTVSGPIRTVSRSVTQPASSRLKTASELRREIASRRTSRTYATISPRSVSWATLHLTTSAPDHTYVYQRSQLAGLSLSELEMLHNINHSRNLAISPYASGTQAVRSAAPMPAFTPTVMPTYSPPTMGGCPNGQCPTSPSRSTTTTRTNTWYPGKLLFGR